MVSFICQKLSLFTKGCFESSLVEIGPEVLEKKILNFVKCVFTILLLSPLCKSHEPFFLTNWNPFYSNILCVKFD